MNIQQYVGIIDKLPKEFIEALKRPIVINGIIDTLNESQNDLINVQLICNNPDQYLKKIPNQLNLILPRTLAESKEPYIVNIKSDVNNYRKLYERETKQINKIIESTIESIKQIYPTTKTLQENFKKYIENYLESIQRMQIPLLNKKIGLSEIKFEKFPLEKRNNFINDRNEIVKKIDEFFLDVDQFFNKFSDISIINSNKIEKAIEDFLALPKSVKELADLMIKSKKTFERSCRVFNDLSNKEAIDREFRNFQNPLIEINEMEKKIQEMEVSRMKEGINEQQNNIDQTKKELDEIELKLKKQSDAISQEINQIRKKYGEKEGELEEFTPSGFVDIETENFVKQILAESFKINEQIKVVNKSLNENMIMLIEQSRLDLLFIMDITNSMDIYLDQVKREFFAIIKEIQKECAGIQIFIGFIGYKDFSDLDFGESYINLELTENYDSITQNIQYAKADGGGDIPEDLCGALEFAVNKEWKGNSRFTILVTDSPCHGKQYYDEISENYDNYPDGDKNGRNIEDYIKKLAEDEVSMFCLKINNSTDKMFRIFENVYNNNKKKDSTNQFMYDSGENIYKVVTDNAIKTFRNRKPIDIKE